MNASRSPLSQDCWGKTQEENGTINKKAATYIMQVAYVSQPAKVNIGLKEVRDSPRFGYGLIKLWHILMLDIT